MRVIFNKVGTLFRGQRASIILAATVFAVAGTSLLLFSSAATPVTDIEPESGTLNNVAVVNDVAASGGNAVSFTGPLQTPDEGRFFKMPDTSSSTKKVFAHYFGPYPIRIQNKIPNDDYYSNNYLRTIGENSNFANIGGLLRDRPWIYPAGGSDWQSVDAAQDIEWAISAGIDGFYVNIMGGSGLNWDRYITLRDVANASYPNFYVVPMIDANGSLAGSGTTDQIADAIAQFASTSYYLGDGRMLVGSFKMEGKTPTWWNNIYSSLQSRHGIDAAPVGVYNNFTQAGNYNQYASGAWGTGADPNIYANRSNYGDQARARGELYQADVWAQDIRPNASLFDEARGTKALFAAWDRAISDGADLVQICTWSDYSEGSQFRPSSARGYVELDLSAWKIAEFKTGSQPDILRDAVYVSHRNQMSNTTVAGPQTSFMSHWVRNNRSAFQEKVEVVTFLTAPADVTVTVGGIATTYSAPAGKYAHEVDARYGSVTVDVKRSGSTVVSHASPYQIRSTVWQQDRQYFMSSSLRDTSLQFDPTETSTGQKPTYPQL